MAATATTLHKKWPQQQLCMAHPPLQPRNSKTKLTPKRLSKLHNLTLSRTITFLANSARMEEAHSLFNTLSNPDTFHYNTIIKGYTNTSAFQQALSLYHRMQAAAVPPDSYTFTFVFKSSSFSEGLKAHCRLLKLGFGVDTFACNALITFYAKLGLVHYAQRVFDEMPVRDMVSWNSIINGYVANGEGWNSLSCFREMQLGDGDKPDRIGVTSALAACSINMCKKLGMEIHCHVVRHGIEADIMVLTSLLDMYCKCGGVDYAERLFERMLTCGNVVTWNVMIAGLVRENRPHDAFQYMIQMQAHCIDPDTVTMVNLLPACEQIGSVSHGKAIHGVTIRRNLLPHLLLQTALFDMYGKCGGLRSAALLFEQMSERSLVSWNTMITTYIQNDESAKALNLFVELLKGPLQPDAFTMSSIVPAYSELASLRNGKQIHCYCVKLGYGTNTYVLNSIIFMYAKCGDLQTSRRLFDGITGKDVVSWNTIVMAYAIHGQGTTSLELFSDMKEDKVEPNESTFVSVLSACSLTGLVEQGWMHFKSMQEEYKMEPQIEHYGCMIDLLGRSGDLKLAVEFIEKMPLKPTARIWGSLLTASRNSNNIVLAEYAADRICELEHDNTGCYVLLSTMYANVGRWGDVERVNSLMKKEGLHKTQACSLVELKSKACNFVNGDRSCIESNLIHEVSEILSRLIGETSNDVNTAFDMRNLPAKRAIIPPHHSLRLAVAFGLISSAAGTPILIKKNIRTCNHCHNALKMISRCSRREIVVGDSTMYHHFSNGLCCCRDYW